MVPPDFTVWHANRPLDNTLDTGVGGSEGYMMLVGANQNPGEIFRITINDLCIGARYEFSVFVANVVRRGSDLIRPNVRFEARTSSADNTLLASTTSGDIDEFDTLTWKQCGMSFFAPTTSIVILMISNAAGGAGNDFVIDDITFRTCASAASTSCPMRESWRALEPKSDCCTESFYYYSYLLT